MKNTFAKKMLILSSAGLLSLGLTGISHADDTPYNEVSLQAEAVRTVANDEMQAILYVEYTEKDAAVLANKLNQTMNKAVATSKKYLDIKVETGSQETYPIYENIAKANGTTTTSKLTAWRGRSAIQLSGQDFKKMGELIAQLQNFMQLQGINFSISEQQRQKVLDQLSVDASKAFQQRAGLIQQAWNAKGYQMKQISFSYNRGGNYYSRAYAVPMMAKAATAVESQDIQGGDSEIRVTVNGTIQLK